MEFDMNSLAHSNLVEVAENQESAPSIGNLLENSEAKNEVENLNSNTLAAVLQILQKHNLKVGEK